jgi:hypothetical protein
MKRKTTGIAMLAAVGAALTTAVLAFGAGGEVTKPETLRLEERGGVFTFDQTGPDKHSFRGDIAVISGPVFRIGTSARGGSLHAICTVMDRPGVIGECTITTFVPQGSLVVSGLVHFGVNDRTKGAIVGGTGHFRNARGEVTFVNSTGDTEGFIFRIEP